jgi:HEPN domain-containing protein
MSKLLAEWIKIAEDDIDTALFCYNGKKYLWVLFMCQQALEKILKALYIKINDNIPPKKHDLIELAGQVGIFEECSEETKDVLRRLTRYYIKTRYPESIAELQQKTDKETTFTLLNKTGEIFKWIKEKLNQ